MSPSRFASASWRFFRSSCATSTSQRVRSSCSASSSEGVKDVGMGRALGSRLRYALHLDCAARDCSSITNSTSSVSPRSSSPLKPSRTFSPRLATAARMVLGYITSRSGIEKSSWPRSTFCVATSPTNAPPLPQPRSSFRSHGMSAIATPCVLPPLFRNQRANARVSGSRALSSSLPAARTAPQQSDAKSARSSIGRPAAGGLPTGCAPGL